MPAAPVASLTVTCRVRPDGLAAVSVPALLIVSPETPPTSAHVLVWMTWSVRAAVRVRDDPAGTWLLGAMMV